LKGLLDDDVSSNILFPIDDFVPPETQDGAMTTRSDQALEFRWKKGKQITIDAFVPYAI